MKRLSRFAVLFTAFVVTIGLMAGVGMLAKAPSVLLPHPVHADGSCGIPTDFDRVPYSDGYWSGSETVQSSSPFTGPTVTVGFDLAAYRVSHDGRCLRSYYGSTWTYDHSNAYSMTAHLRVWICGAPAADFQQVQYQTWGRAVVAYRQNQVWGAPWGSETYAVNTPDGNTWLLDFADYTPCGRQADNQITSAVNGYWSPSTAFVYVNVNG